MDSDKFVTKINEIDWEDKLGGFEDVDDMCEEFTKQFLNVARECIPTKHVTVRSKDKSWFTSELRKEIRIRDRLRKKVLKSKREIDKEKYKKQRNKVNNMKKIAKERFENNLDNILLESSNKPKSYWKLMKMLIKSNKGSNNMPPLVDIVNEQTLGETVFEDEHKCELLNKYFCSINKLQEENISVPEFAVKTDSSINNIEVTIQDIVDIITILDPKKANGPDKISHRMLKICPEKIAVPLQIIFNKSLTQQKYPSNWKIANIIAIFKKGDASLPSNYRPISLISCVGKIMERVVYKYVFNIKSKTN